MGVHLTGVYLMGMHLMRVPDGRPFHWHVPHGRAFHWALHLMGMHLVGVYLMGVYLGACTLWRGVSQGFQIFHPNP
jgi:hypothetical protein